MSHRIKKRKIWLGAFILGLLFQLDLIQGHLRLGEDLLSFHYPLHQAVIDGDTDFSFHLGIGMNLLAESQVGLLNPFNCLLRLFPLSVGFAFVTVLLQILAFAGMGFLLKARGLSGPATGVGMLAHAGSLCLLLRVEQWPNFQMICLMPWLFYFQEKSSRSLALPACLLACGLLAGAPQFVFIALLGWVINGFLQDCFCWRQTLLILIFSVGLAMPQLEALWDLFVLGERSFGTSYWQHSLPWHHLLGLVMPLPFGAPALENYVGGGPHWEFALFSGSLVFLIFCLRAPSKFKAATLLVILLALGDQIPIVRDLFSWPPFSLFRAPARYSILAIFFIACGAAHGLNQGLVDFQKKYWLKTFLWILGLLSFVLGSLMMFSGLLQPIFDFLWSAFEGLVAQVVGQTAHSEIYFKNLLIQVGQFFVWQIAALSILWILFLSFLQRQKINWLVLLIFFELFVSAHLSRTTVDFESLEKSHFPDQIEGLVWISPLERERDRIASGEQGQSWQERILAAHPFVPSMILGLNQRDPSHHSPLRNRLEKRWQRLLKENPDNLILQKRAGIQWRKEIDQWVSLSVPNVLFYPGEPRVESTLIEKRLLIESVQDSLHWHEKVLRTEAWQVNSQRPNDRLMTISLPREHPAGWVRLPLVFQPAWEVWIDGNEVRTESVDLIQLAFPVSKDARQVTVRFESRIPTWPRVVSALAILLLLLRWWVRQKGYRVVQ